MNTFFDWAFVDNPQSNKCKTYCLRCGVEIERNKSNYEGNHNWFCRLRKNLTCMERFIKIPLDKLVDNGSDKLSIKR